MATFNLRTLMASAATTLASFTGTVEAQQSTPPSQHPSSPARNVPNITFDDQSGIINRIFTIKNVGGFSEFNDAVKNYYDKLPDANSFDKDNVRTRERDQIIKSAEALSGLKIVSINVNATEVSVTTASMQSYPKPPSGSVTVNNVSTEKDPTKVREILKERLKHVGNLLNFLEASKSKDKKFQDAILKAGFVSWSGVHSGDGRISDVRTADSIAGAVSELNVHYTELSTALITLDNNTITRTTDQVRRGDNTTTRTTDPRLNPGNNPTTVLPTAPSTNTAPAVPVPQFNDPVAAMVAMNNGGTVVDTAGVTHNYPGFANAAKAFNNFNNAFAGTEISQNLQKYLTTQIVELKNLKYDNATANVIAENELFATASALAAKSETQNFYKNDPAKLAALKSLAAFADYAKANPKLGLWDPVQPKAGFNSQYTVDKEVFDKMRENDEWDMGFTHALSQTTKPSAAPTTAPVKTDAATPTAAPKLNAEQSKEKSAAPEKIDLAKLRDVKKFEDKVQNLFETVIAPNTNPDFADYRLKLQDALFNTKEIKSEVVDGKSFPEVKSMVQWTVRYANKNLDDPAAKEVKGYYTAVLADEAKITAQMQSNKQKTK